MSQCEKCKQVTDSRQRTTLRCFGRCKKVYHHSCIDWNFEKYKTLFKERPYVRFVCADCQNHEEDTIYEEFNKINKFVEELKQHLCANRLKLNEQLGEIKSHVEEIHKPDEAKSFAAVVKTNPTKLVLLQPKKPQENKKTKEDIVSQIDPKSIPLMGYRNVSNGGIILQCDSNEAKEKLKQIATDKLGTQYEIKLPAELKPRVKILGMSEQLESDEIISALKQQNSFLADSYIKVVTTYRRRNTQKVDTIIEVDSTCYKKIMEAEKLNINFDRCHVPSGHPNPELLRVINLTAIAVRRLIKMAKKINAFKNMCQEDQLALLKGGCIEMMILRSVMQFDEDQNTWKIPHSKPTVGNIRADVLKLAKGNIYEKHKLFISNFEKKWRSDINIIPIMCAITLFTPNRSKIVHSDVIKLEQTSYYCLLRRYLESIYTGCEAKSTFLKLVNKLHELQKLNDEVINVYLDVNPAQVEPLLLEIFDLKQGL